MMPEVFRRRRRAVSSGAQTIVSDTFNRADSATTLGSAETGQLWTVSNGTGGISSNQAYNAAGATQSLIATVDSGKADCTVSSQVGAGSTDTTDFGLYFRFADVNNFWRFIYSGTTYFFQKVVAGATTTVDSQTAAVAPGNTIAIVLAGSSITVKVNGATLTSTSDAALATNTKHGIGNASTDTGQRWDNFTVTVP